MFKIKRVSGTGPDGSLTPQPHELKHIPKPEIGHFLNGISVRVGQRVLQATWRLMTWEKMKNLQDLFDPNDPEVYVTYPNPDTGVFTERKAIMHEPVVGAEEVLHLVNVVVTFSHLELPEPGTYLRLEEKTYEELEAYTYAELEAL